MRKTIIFACLSIFLIAACVEQDENEMLPSQRLLTITATVPSGQTRIGLSAGEGTLDLISKWEDGEEIQVFAKQGEKVVKLEPSYAYNIQENGKQCSFAVHLGEELDIEQPFELYGLCGVEGYVKDGRALMAKSKMWRVSTWGQAKAAMWFHVSGGAQCLNGPIQVHFQHLGTYEVLHLKSTSNRGVHAQHLGFQVSTPWYKYYEETPLPVGSVQSTSSQSGEAHSAMNFVYNGQPVEFVSWYIPSGQPLKDARLRMSLGGVNYTSVNTKSSSVSILPGHAYHMYATWDGENLRFDEDAPVEVSNFEVTKANYYPNYFTHEGRSYSFRYYCTAYITLKDAADLEDWGYIYIDPDGKESAPISLVQYQNSPGVVGDPRYSYYRNEPTATVKLKTYVKRRSQTEPIYGDEQEFTIEYPSVCSISMNSCTFQGTTFDEIYGGRMYKYKTTYRFVFSASGAYWMKVRTDERGSGWTDWPNLPNRTMSPVDGNKANALTVNYYYDDKTMTGDFQVYLMGDDATHGICYTSLEYVDYHHDGSKFTGFTYHPASSASNEYPSASRSMANDDEIPVLNVVLNKVNPN